MRRKIVNPRIVLLDCNLEYKKGESMTNKTLKTSVESACMILIIDDIVSGIKKSKQVPIGQAQAAPAEQAETVIIFF